MVIYLENMQPFLLQFCFLNVKIECSSYMNSLYLTFHVWGDSRESNELGIIANDKHTYTFSGQNIFNTKKIHESLL
jgi:hypothetical protein